MHSVPTPRANKANHYSDFTMTAIFRSRIGGGISSAKVGDELAIHFEIEDFNSPYEIFVRELVASDGVVSKN